MTKPLFVAIGVHKAKNMPALDGVLTAVRDLSTWADEQGYEVVRIVDDKAPVTVDRIRDELTPRDPATGDRDPKRLLERPRIVVYFCGHGLHAPQDQYWILSPGPSQPDERISAVGLRDMLATYGPKQIAIISDACRSPQALQGLASSVVPAHEALAGVVEKDNFFSAQEGEAAFAFPSREGHEAFCIFSSVLFRALSAPCDEEALDLLYLQTGRRIVSSQSLASYLERKVPDAALDLGRLQVPQCDPSFRPLDNDYVEFPGPGASTDLDLHPDELQTAAEERRASAQKDRIERSRSEWRGPYVRHLQERMEDTLRGSDGKRASMLIASRADRSRMSLWGRGGQREGAPWHLDFDPSRTASWFPDWLRDGFVATDRSSVIVANVDDIFVPIPLHRGLWCAAIIESATKGEEQTTGVELLAWGNPWFLPNQRLTAAEALKGLSAGTLNAADTAILAADMRNSKHADPMYGIVSAYLYNAVGDVANIRRMCYYYVAHGQGQDVPFDIAMMAQLDLRERYDGGFYVEVPEVEETPQAERPANWEYLPDFTWERTSATRVDVAGVTPLLRAGWQHIQASRHRVHRACWELAGHLTPSPVAALRGREAGRLLLDTLRSL